MKNLPLLLGLVLLFHSSSLHAQFAGGVGCGVDLSSIEGISLNGEIIVFPGGIGRGDAVSSSNQGISLDGVTIAFPGGIGRGDAMSSSNQGISLNGGFPVYTGGIGRGDVAVGFADSYLNGSMPISVRLFIEGYYSGGSLMSPVLFNNGLSISSTDCDSIIVELHDALNPASVLFTQKTLLHTNGVSGIAVPPDLLGNSCYIVVKHRNALETWSKVPVQMVNNQFFDFSHP